MNQLSFAHEYLSNSEVKKLHLGCGRNLLEGWLNTDINPVNGSSYRLDSTHPFPLPDDAFHFVFSEHMIEHITFAQGQQMLSECFRVLRPGGVIRISTPDLSFLMDLYKEDRSDTHSAYIEWATKLIVPESPLASAAFVINNFVRAWGHRFIYNEQTLRFSLEQSGFSHIVRRQLSESEHYELRTLENESRLPPGFLQLETLTLEGIKPVIQA
jgi:predicted SAM-dependent methyltransferase